MENDKLTAGRSAQRCREFEPISEREAENVLACLRTALFGQRNTLIYLLAYELAMSARQIAETTWQELLHAGTHLPREALDIYPLYPNARQPKQKPVSPRLAAAIRAFAEKCENPLQGHAFKNRNGVKLSPQSVDQVFKYWFHRLGIGRKSIASVQRLCLARAAKTQLTSYPMVRRAARKPAAAQAPAATKFRGTHATVTVQPMGGEARQGLDRLLHDAPLSVDHLDSARERPPAAGNRR